MFPDLNSVGVGEIIFLSWELGRSGSDRSSPSQVFPHHKRHARIERRIVKYATDYRFQREAGPIALCTQDHAVRVSEFVRIQFVRSNAPPRICNLFRLATRTERAPNQNERAPGRSHTG